jgi:ribonucleoside-diphosphate reductase beta chain
LTDRLEPKKLFNPREITLDSRRLIGGETNGIMMLSNNKYDWTFKLYRHMMGNFWIPEEIPMGQDKIQYDSTLTDHEREAFDKIISFLVFLDSLQTSNLPNIGDFITLPEVGLLITIQGFQEAVHSQSYGYILDSVVNAEQKSRIYGIAVQDPYLIRRNKLIADYYEEFIDHQSNTGFAKVAMANYILEGIYFYAGFSFFYNLARNGKMTSTGSEIRYINRDELSHLAVFQGVFRELRKENPEIFTTPFESVLRNMMQGAVEHEIEWCEYAIGNRIQGLSVDLIGKYIKYLSNFRLQNIGIAPLYPEIDTDPLPFIAQFTNFNQMKTDFFEEKVTNYAKGALKMGENIEINLEDLEI